MHRAGAHWMHTSCPRGSRLHLVRGPRYSPAKRSLSTALTENEEEKDELPSLDKPGWYSQGNAAHLYELLKKMTCKPEPKVISDWGRVSPWYVRMQIQRRYQIHGCRSLKFVFCLRAPAASVLLPLWIDELSVDTQSLFMTGKNTDSREATGLGSAQFSCSAWEMTFW